MKILVALMLCAVSVQARVAGTRPAVDDSWCAYGSAGQAGSSVTGAETCIDYQGNVIPTVTSAQTLGSASLVWSNVYALTATVGAGGIANSGPMTSGTLVLSRTNVLLNTATMIPVTTSFENLNNNTNNVSITLTATPTLATAGIASGTVMFLSATGTQSVVVQDAGTLTGSGLQLASANRTLTQYKTLQLIYDNADGFWREISFGAN